MASTKVKYRRTSKGSNPPVRGLANKLETAENLTLRKDFPIYAAGDTVKGTVRMVAPTVDPLTRNGFVYVDLPVPGSARALDPGFVARRRPRASISRSALDPPARDRSRSVYRGSPNGGRSPGALDHRGVSLV